MGKLLVKRGAPLLEDIPVLVIEDNQDHRFLVLLQLNRHGIYDVKIVPSIAAGIDACRERPRDVVVVDSGVVGEEGRDALERLRQAAAGARVIGYSSVARSEDWADAHFLKGNFEEVIAEIRKGPRLKS